VVHYILNSFHCGNVHSGKFIFKQIYLQNLRLSCIMSFNWRRFWSNLNFTMTIFNCSFEIMVVFNCGFEIMSSLVKMSIFRNHIKNVLDNTHMQNLKLYNRRRQKQSGGTKKFARGRAGRKVPALGDFCNFSIKITHFYAYFGQNGYFKAIIHQLKAFEKQSKRTKSDK